MSNHIRCLVCSDGVRQTEAAVKRLLGSWWWHRVDSRMQIKRSLMVSRL